MKRVLGMLCIVGSFLALLSGYSACNSNEYQVLTGNKTNIYENQVTEQSSVEDEIIINTVHVTEQPLSEIITEESDPFAKCYNSYQPFLVSDNDVYSVFPGNSAEYYQYYENLGDEPAYLGDEPACLGVPQTEDFKVNIIIDNTIYALEYDHSDWFSAYITRFKNGVGKRLTDETVEGCYFAEDGIYYQNGNKIYLMDYDGQNSELIVEIPDLLYVDSIHSKFIVYRGKLWYAYDDFSKEYYYPLWCYDFEGTFTRFDNGGLDAVNNGYLYYTAEGSDDHDVLYRFNCNTYSVEPVIDASDIGSYCFADDYILYSSWNSVTSEDSLYRLGSGGSAKILSADRIKRGTSILGVSCNNNRIFVHGADDPEDYWEIEIDIDGNIIKTFTSME